MSQPDTRPDPDPALQSALDRLKRFHPKSMDLSLDRIDRLLHELGNPQLRLPPVIHVAGTNGKGSTVAFMRAMLEAAGLKVHAYISPHLVRFNERIRIAGALIGDEALLNLIDEVEAVNAGQPITFFEITTAMAFHAFATHPADAVLLETGLGGILDATNVVPTVAASVITRISYDHTHLLGDTIKAIAGEKAGIIKSGCPVILSAQREPDAVDVVENTAWRLNAPLFAYGKQWRIETTAPGCRYQDEEGTLDLPPPGLLGDHQRLNAGAAIAALRHSKLFDLAPSAFVQGMTRVEWPGRLQRLTSGPLTDFVPAGWELWLDGGHNDSGGEVLAEQAAAWADRPLFMIYGMLSTKQPLEFLRPLAPHIRMARTVTIPETDLSLPASETCRLAREAGFKDVDVSESVAEALADLCADQQPPSRILICGSLYLAGYVLAENG